MSSPLAIGAVSAVLRNVLAEGIAEAGASLGATVTVSSSAPQAIDRDGVQEPLRLNVFLYHVTANGLARHPGLPPRPGAGDRIAAAPLALDLHYLVTAYPQDDFRADVLLGHAMRLLHERPLLDRAAVRRALDPGARELSASPSVRQALSAFDFADDADLLKITPMSLSVDAMSNLWSALQARLRPSAAYQVSMVLV